MKSKISINKERGIVRLLCEPDEFKSKAHYYEALVEAIEATSTTWDRYGHLYRNRKDDCCVVVVDYGDHTFIDHSNEDGGGEIATVKGVPFKDVLEAIKLFAPQGYPVHESYGDHY